MKYIFLLIGAILGIATFFAVDGHGASLLVEAESFDHRGGWLIDQQSMTQLGSAYLIANGLGKPVADAVTTVDFPHSGTYTVFVRTRNWVAPWTGETLNPEAPGRFQVLLDGKPLDTVFGTVRNDWHWQRGGLVSIDQPGKKELALRDLTGFNGRCDAILFCDDAFVPPGDPATWNELQRRLLNLPQNPLDAPIAKECPFDLVVCGGGMSGLSAAIAGARLGLKVALIQDRPVLGGNSSSEVRVAPSGRSIFPAFPNLGNLGLELDPLHMSSGEADRIKHKLVEAEPLISLFLSNHVFALEKKGNRITAVIGRNIATNRETRWEGTLFADCTGDGTIGVLAGNEWRMGRESKAETGEHLASEKSDNLVMGASAQWTTRETPQNTTFPSLPWAVRFVPESIKPEVFGGWNWECGFERNQIADIERIRDQGLRAAFGHWDYMKNDMKDPMWSQRVAKREFAWIACIIGKRESRRLIGDHVLCEQDIIQRIPHPDGIVPFVWHIDLHVPDRENTKFFPGDEFRTGSGSVDKKILAYTIPYRCLYAKDVENLFIAGRCISVTHVGLGPVRVQRTTGMMGELVGMAASLCQKHKTLPRGVYQDHLDELKELAKKGVAPSPKKIPEDAQGRMMSDRGETDLMESGLRQVLGTPF